MTGRTVFTAALLTPEAKKQLREEAGRQRMSMSALVSKIVDEYFRKRRGRTKAK